MNSLTGVKRIYVLSKSPVKRDAVMRWLRLSGRKKISVYFVNAADTGCPQPFGEHSAFQCLARRIPQLYGGGHTLWVGIENYIYCAPSGDWCDAVAVSFTYVTASGLVLTVMTSGQFGNLIPSAFEPKGGPDINEPLGFSETVGRRIHAARRDVPHDNWGKQTHVVGIDRRTQIVDALRTLDLKINAFASAPLT